MRAVELETEIKAKKRVLRKGASRSVASAAPRAVR